MAGILARITLGSLLVVALAFVACGHIVPERYAVNAPLGQLLLGRGIEPPAPDAVRKLLSVPDGFAVDLWATGLPNARFLRFTPAGDLLLSTPRSGRVVLLERDANGDGRTDGVRTLLEGLDRPHGLDLRNGWLYVGETGAIARVRFDAASGRTEGPVERIVSDLPAGGNHWTRTIRFGPDGWLYVSVGSSCNVCIEQDPRRAAILRFQPDGSSGEIFAAGLRNSVGFDWQPGTDALYATDNGRDLLGDDSPPCELNRIVQGGFYGWPFANGDRVPDPDLGAGYEDRIATSIPPVHGFRAHNAPLGITFLRSEHWEAPYRGAALVALHGSWNRTRKDGYEVVSLHWRPDGQIEERPFLMGFLGDDRVIGRPVDVAEGPDGAIYVSDDYAGAVYRIRPDNAVSTSVNVSVPAPAITSGIDPLTSLAIEERPAVLERGAALYAEHRCGRCHDPEGADPDVIPVPLEPARLRSRYDLASLTEYLLAPTPPMPAFPLSPLERLDVAAYLLARGED
jgi:glucose/arabinose dehydrogenase